MGINAGGRRGPSGGQRGAEREGGVPTTPGTRGLQPLTAGQGVGRQPRQAKLQTGQAQVLPTVQQEELFIGGGGGGVLRNLWQ